MQRTGLLSNIGVKKSPIGSGPTVSIAFRDLGNGAVDTGAGASKGVGAAIFTRATNAACRLANGNWKLDVANGVARSHYLLGKIPAYMKTTNTAAGSYAFSPSTAATQITGSLTLIAFKALDNWLDPAPQAFGGKWDGVSVQRSYHFSIANGQLIFSTTNDNLTSQTFQTAAAVPFTNFSFGWVKVEYLANDGSGNRRANFFTSTNGINWTFLESIRLSGLLPIVVNTAELSVSAISLGNSFGSNAKASIFQIYSGVGSAAVLVADFNPSRAAAIGSTSFVASTGETWTLFNTAYIDANPVYGGLLYEAASTQLALNPRDMTNASWVKTSMTAAQTATGMDGVVNSATTLTATGANGTAIQTLVAAASSRTYSCWIKRRTGTGTIEITQDGAAWTNVTAQVNSSNFLQVQLNASILNASFGIRLGTNGDAIDVDCNQFEAGDCATTPIPSGGVRNNDSLSYPFTPVTQGVGTQYAEISAVSILTPPSPKVWNAGVDNSAANNNWNRIIFTSNQLDGIGNNAGPQWDAIGRTIGVLGQTVYKTIQAYMLNNIGYCAEGIVTEAIGAGTPATDINRIVFAISANASACVKNFRYWPTRLSNAQLRSLTN